MTPEVIEAISRLTKRAESPQEPRWVSAPSYGLRRSSKPLDASLFERVTSSSLPRGTKELEPEAELWATQAKLDANKVDVIPLTSDKPIIVLRFKERDWVVDGHHRIARARKEGVTLKATVYNADLQVAKNIIKAHVPEPDPDMEQHVRSHMNRAFGGDLGNRTMQQARVNADNLTSRDGVHHRTGGRWKHSLIDRVKKHLQGQHSQKTHGRRSAPQDQLTKFTPPDIVADALSKWFGDKPDTDWHEVRQDHKRQMKIADAYDSLPDFDEDAVPSYRAMADETAEQFRFLTKDIGIKFEAVDQDPYRNVREMVADVERNHTLKVMSTKTTGGHPFFSNDENDKFRFVHDFFGHAATGRDFDRHGEQAAYLAHREMYSDKARPAMSSETLGQNASLIKNGDFPPQKVALLPEEFMKHLKGEHDQDDHGNRDPAMGKHTKTEQTNVELLWLFRDFDRDEKTSRFKETLESVKREGFREPIIIDYNPETGKAYVSEGNHRLKIARMLGRTTIPARVIRSTDDNPKMQYVPGALDRVRPDKFPELGPYAEQVPGDMKPSDVFGDLGDEVNKHLLGRHDQKLHGRWAHDAMRFEMEVLGGEVRWTENTWVNPSGDTMMKLLDNPGARDLRYRTSKKHPGLALLWNKETKSAVLLNSRGELPELRRISGPRRMFERGRLAVGNVQVARERGEAIASDLNAVMPPGMRRELHDLIGRASSKVVAAHGRTEREVSKHIEALVAKHLPGQHDQRDHGNRRAVTQSKFLRGRLERSGGYGYQPVFRDTPTSGKAVSLKGYEVETSGIPTRSNITSFINRHYDFLQDNPDHYVGGWYDERTGRGYLDIHIVVDTREEAERVGRDNEQIAYYDLDDDEVVEVRGGRELRKSLLGIVANHIKVTADG